MDSPNFIRRGAAIGAAILLTTSASSAQPGCLAAAASAAPGCPGFTMREHMRRIASFKSWEECRAYMDDWRARHADPMPGPGAASMPMRDVCAGLPRIEPDIAHP